MARAHTKLSARVGDLQHEFKGRRNAGGTLHRRGKGRKREASPIIAEAVVVHVEQQETALEAKIVAGLARANAKIEAHRAAEAGRVLAAAAQARRDICNIVHVMSSVAKKEAHIAALFAQYGK